MNQNTYVAAFQTWNGGMSRLVTGEENVQRFIEDARDSFAKLHLFIDEETANEEYDREWKDLFYGSESVGEGPKVIGKIEIPDGYNSPEDNGWFRGVDGGLYEDYEQSIGE